MRPFEALAAFVASHSLRSTAVLLDGLPPRKSTRLSNETVRVSLNLLASRWRHDFQCVKLFNLTWFKQTPESLFGALLCVWLLVTIVPRDVKDEESN